MQPLEGISGIGALKQGEKGGIFPAFRRQESCEKGPPSPLKRGAVLLLPCTLYNGKKNRRIWGRALDIALPFGDNEGIGRGPPLGACKRKGRFA